MVPGLPSVVECFLRHRVSCLLWQDHKPISNQSCVFQHGMFFWCCSFVLGNLSSLGKVIMESMHCDSMWMTICFPKQSVSLHVVPTRPNVVDSIWHWHVVLAHGRTKPRHAWLIASLQRPLHLFGFSLPILPSLVCGVCAWNNSKNSLCIMLKAWQFKPASIANALLLFDRHTFAHGDDNGSHKLIWGMLCIHSLHSSSVMLAHLSLWCSFTASFPCGCKSTMLQIRRVCKLSMWLSILWQLWVVGRNASVLECLHLFLRVGRRAKAHHLGSAGNFSLWRNLHAIGFLLAFFLEQIMQD